MITSFLLEFRCVVIFWTSHYPQTPWPTKQRKLLPSILQSPPGAQAYGSMRLVNQRYHWIVERRWWPPPKPPPPAPRKSWHTVVGKNPAPAPVDMVVYPMIYGMKPYMSGAGFIPTKVVGGQENTQESRHKHSNTWICDVWWFFTDCTMVNHHHEKAPFGRRCFGTCSKHQTYANLRDMFPLFSGTLEIQVWPEMFRMALHRHLHAIFGGVQKWWSWNLMNSSDCSGTHPWKSTDDECSNGCCVKTFIINNSIDTFNFNDL